MYCFKMQSSVTLETKNALYITSYDFFFAHLWPKQFWLYLTFSDKFEKPYITVDACVML